MHFLGGAVKPLAITCRGKTDGAGAQVHAALSVIAFCQRVGVPYFHSPLIDVEHLKSADEIAQWENHFSLSKFSSVETSKVIAGRTISLAEFKGSSRQEKKESVLAIEHAHAFTESHPSSYVPLRHALRQYALNHPTEPDDRVNIAVHIRRGDVSPTRNPERFTSNDNVTKSILAASHIVLSAGLVPSVTIYSQGDPDEFSDIVKATECGLCLDADPLDTLRKMADSDLLIMSKSSLSFLAAFLCNGVVVYEPFWHKPMGHWVNIEAGEIGDGILRAARNYQESQ